MEAKNRRFQAIVDMRKGLVLSSARQVISRLGVQNASIREIAKEAGYTPGALYAYFENRNELLLSLLEEALARLLRCVEDAAPGKVQGVAHQAKAVAWISYLQAHPDELELLMYFLGGAGQANANPDRISQIHAALRQTLRPVLQSSQIYKAESVGVEAELESFLAFGMGLLLTQNSTLLQPSELSPEVLLVQYLERLVRQSSSISESSEAALAGSNSHAGQVDLFES